MAKAKEPLYFICIDCGDEFVFPVTAQEYFDEQRKPYPKRCKTCHNTHERGMKKLSQDSRG